MKSATQSTTTVDYAQALGFDSPDQSNWSEAKLQSECFKWHHKEFPQYRGLLFTVDNNANDKVKGSIRKALGRVSGVSDMIYLHKGKAYFIELKLYGCQQSKDQKQWEKAVADQGFDYTVCSHLDDFKRIIVEIHRHHTILPF